MDDLIKREDVLKELCLDHKDVIYIDKTECARRIKAIPSADRPSESIGKLIERMEEYRDKQLLMSDYWYGINWAINTIRVSDVADRPQGEWIWDNDAVDWNLGAWICSNCHARNDNLPHSEIITPLRWSGSKFCPNCGCRMKGADDE